MAFAEAFKAGSKNLTIIINSEGKAVEAEKREDEQQKVKYLEIIGLLIEAGYFRAKIKGISEFDKVVGGMTWCIDFCNVDLDVDLLFQENSTIGQKIALTEKLVAALKKLNCPNIIEPHQIQGLDFINIYPVIQWLVKKSDENREERGDYLKQYLVHRFNNEFCFPDEKPNENFIKRALPHITAVQTKYRIQRRFRRGEEGADLSSDPLSRIQSTLFEYGHAPLHQEEKSGEGKTEHIETIDEVKLKQMIKLMKSTTDDIKLAPKTITTIVNMKSDEIRDAAKNYNTQMAVSQMGEKAEMKRLREKESQLLEQKCAVEADLRTAHEKLGALKSKANFKKESEVDLSEEEKTLLHQIEARLLLNNALAEQVLEFKDYCKAEKTRLEALIREAEENDNLSDTTTETEIGSLESLLAEARILLAKVSRKEAMLHRVTDQVPSRAELTQYQRRFVELYNQVSAKYKETKQYFTLYNSMSDQREYLNKELRLLDSILEGYNTSVSFHAKEEFVNKLESIVDGIKQNKAKVETKRNEERDRKDRLRSQLFGLIEQQRQYASLLKQFTEECQLTQALCKQLKAAPHSGLT